MGTFLGRMWAGFKALPIQMFGLQAIFGSGTGPVKKAAIMDLLRKSIGLAEGVVGQDVMDESEFVAGIDQAAEGILRALKATRIWRDRFPKAV